MNNDKFLQFNQDNYQDIIDSLMGYSKTNSLYSGKSGAIIYLLELYDITQDTTLLQSAEKIAIQIYDSIKDRHFFSYSFFTGNMGIAFAFIKLFQQTNNEQQLEWAIEIAKKSKVHLEIEKVPVIDLLNGVSGILLGLLHIKNLGIITDDWLVNDIKFYTDLIISTAELGKEGGICWDKDNKVNQGLTGFSHGASGIGFVFYELFKLTGIDSFKDLCFQTFKYEDYSYDSISKNWLDHRKYPYSPEEEVIFDYHIKSGNIDFFLEKKVMTAWCHGAPGIALSRYNANYNDSLAPGYFETIYNSLEYTANHSICHSAVGNALCLLSLGDNHITLVNSQMIDLSNKLLYTFERDKTFVGGNKDITYKDSLFMGNLGVLYFLLKMHRLINKLEIKDNILFPALTDVKRDMHLEDVFATYSFQHISKAILSRSYSRTIHFLSANGNGFPNLTNDIENSFVEYMNSVSDPITRDAFKFEKKLRKIDNAVGSYSYVYFQAKLYNEIISDDQLDISNLEVMINSNCSIIQSNWNWDKTSNPNWTSNGLMESDICHFAVIPGFNNYVLLLNNFSFQLIEHINENKILKIGDLVDYFTTIVTSNKSEIEAVQNLLFNKIKNFIKIGVIKMVLSNQ